jgi:NAD+ kinase
MPASPASSAQQQIIALVVRHNTAGVEEPVARIQAFLEQAGYRVVFEQDTATHLQMEGLASMTVAEIGQQAKIAIVVGGDGTMLGIARQLAAYDIALIGINQGRLGFITDIPLDNMLPALGEILQGRWRA